MPTIRYGVTPSGLRLTESPTVRIDFTTTPGTDLMMYGDCELLGPDVAPRFCAASGEVIVASTRSSAHFDLKANFILFTFLC
jgi:hypothetical protein